MLDALILERCQHFFTSCWGTSQGGGVFDGLSTVLALVLLGQLRMEFALPLILVFLDLVAAYDVADRNDIRNAASAAGVEGQLWLLIDTMIYFPPTVPGLTCLAQAQLPSPFRKVLRKADAYLDTCSTAV